MSDYRATVTREGKWWMIAVAGIAGVTQARRLAEAETMAKSFIAITLDVPEDDVTVEVDVHLSAGIEAHMQRAKQLRDTAAQAQSDAAIEVRAAAAAMKAADMPLRDIGAALGVSYQRAHQLVSPV